MPLKKEALAVTSEEPHSRSLSELKGERIETRYVRLRDLRFWSNNPKLHDIGLLVTMFQNYGFVDPPKWDVNINNGEGGLIYGNGRVEALMWMYNDGMEPPRGVLIDEEGKEWYVPVEFGIYTFDPSHADALAIDHNSATLAGGEIGLYDNLKIYDENKLLRVLSIQQERDYMPLTFDKQDLSALVYMQDPDALPPAVDEEMPDDKELSNGGMRQGDRELEGRMPSICGSVEPALYAVYLAITSDFGETHTDRLEGLLRKYEHPIPSKGEFD